MYADAHPHTNPVKSLGSWPLACLTSVWAARRRQGGCRRRRPAPRTPRARPLISPQAHTAAALEPLAPQSWRRVCRRRSVAPRATASTLRRGAPCEALIGHYSRPGGLYPRQCGCVGCLPWARPGVHGRCLLSQCASSCPAAPASRLGRFMRGSWGSARAIHVWPSVMALRQKACT